MVRTIDVIVNLCRLDFISSEVRHKEVINTPTDISFPCVHPIRPPRIFLFVWMKVSEGINKAGIKKFAKLAPFLIRKARIEMIPVRIGKVYVTERNVQIPTDYDGLSFWGIIQ